MNPTTRNLFLWSVIAAVLFVIFQMFPGSSSQQSGNAPLAYSQFINDINDNKVAEVTLSGQHVLGKTKDGRSFVTYAPETQTMVTKLLEKNVIVKALPLDHDLSIFQLLLPWLPILLLVGLTLYSFRQMQSGGNRAMGFGKSKARLMGDKAKKVTFEDVAGIDEAKQELQEIVDFLKDPQKFQRLGGRIPRGVLLIGPPGTGKTLLAKAISGEADVPFFSISGSDFVEMFVGVGASRVRDMFEQAKKNAPCIIFMDEIDAVGRHRGVGMGGGNDEREQTLNQLLVEMDGFEENESVILVAATNRPDILDPALLRPGRFDRQVVVPNPDVNGREQILKVHMRKVPLAPNVEPRVIARGTPGFSGADLANLVNEAALMAARRGKLVVSMNEFEQAKDKVMMGTERRSMVMTEEQKKETAYHEAGHAILAFFSSYADPIHKATIIPRGRALGMVMQLPEGDSISYYRGQILTRIKILTAGHIAETLIFGRDKLSTGPSDDIKRATKLARLMVTEWGMSDKLGFQLYDASNESASSYTPPPSKNFSEETAQTIDQEITSILTTCYQQAQTLLTDKIDLLHRLAQELCERETLTGEEIKIVLEGGTLPDPIGFSETSAPRPSVPLSGQKPKTAG